MTKDHIVSFFFITLLIFILYQTVRILSPFFHPFFWAMILAYAIYPLYEMLKKRLKNREALAAAVMTVAIFLIIIPVLVMFVANITGQAIELYQISTDYIRNGHLENLIDRIRSIAIVEKIETKLFRWEPIKENASAWLLNSTKAVTNYSIHQAGNITKNVFFVGLNIVLITFLTFISLKDGRKIHDFIYQIAPLEEKNKKLIFSQINETFAAVIRGQLLTSLTQALVAGLIFWVLGIPLALFFGIATFITALIPVLGAAGIWGPLVLYLAFVMHAYIKAVILLIVGIFGISLIDNVMKPALIGEKTKLPFFLLFFGILGGIKLYGILGVFLAPVILSLFFSLIKIYQEKFS